MALLIPLLLPHVVQATTNIGIGISNAIQGTSSSVSFQIGNKVFTTNKGFPLHKLPPEIRQRILLIALEESKSLILPPPKIFDPMRPMTEEDFSEIRKQNPLHPDSEHYHSIVGDRVSANGYPISSWRWMGICTEWNETLKEVLWENCEITGSRPYSTFIRLIEGNKPFSALGKIRSLTFGEGFQTPTDLYTIMSNPALTNLEEISILPNYPTPFHPLISPMPPFIFGLQLIPARNHLKSLTFGLPLEISTNQSSRQHLRTLRVPKLNLTFVQPTVSIFQELKDLTADTTEILGIRYVSVRTLTDCSVLLCEPLQSFKKINLYLNLPRAKRVLSGPEGNRILIDDPSSPVLVYVTRLISLLEVADLEVQKRYTVYNVSDWEIPGGNSKGKAKKIWPFEEITEEEGLMDEMDEMDELISGSSSGKTKKVVEKEKKKEERKSDSQQWERQTDLRLFGGLIGLRLESKKH